MSTVFPGSIFSDDLKSLEIIFRIKHAGEMY